MTETVLTNARIVLPDIEIEGHLVLREGRIAAIGDGPAAGEDMAGDTLIPGLVELHTDHIEGHYIPRPKVLWNKMAAIQAHDAQIAGSGITTVFDALRVGTDENATLTSADMAEMGRMIGRAVDENRLRADHFIHLRCEVSAGDVVDGFRRIEDNPRLKLVSLMDHAPGQRQFADLGAYRTYYQKKLALSDAEFEAFSNKRLADSAAFAPMSRKEISEACRARGIAVASHDDATPEHVAEAIELGTSVAEFPTTMAAAEASRQAGLHVLMGAPNIVRGGSHSGNISAIELLRRGVLDILSSDYVPFSMVQAAFLLAESGEVALPEAIRLVSTNSAEAVGLTDRGAIETGRRADLVRVHAVDGEPPVVRSVWREGRRVA
ncbi:alpha-D-ribose 1-methylphosphonate 5-triphosphate diphosphatase [Mangrovibrevibacter kandeliae]|uniref:alpha-D-ribose 1-methylphosphonate 5-triphosphate diphosphatase n=1 Tax=Mangrovibrevibacter kandeliae TaxID=2968473 RepID=UPI0021186E56|nr:alpha-D-ribose 1-methylphosphonate 5-triphosphate diphosphatase [Aurantimonas sp. CSK15Z-1]MCQ8781235.1 alpha-D-ribose 1-methylphosphonate 5-triphosphate diphosphatase [Aurantimonas sp. CSK15Z-1]